MPSSTSSSRLTRATWVLLAGCALIAFGVEAAARVGFHRASKIQRRFVTEYAQAEKVGVERHDGQRTSVLVVGNSLLLEGVAFDQLHDGLAAEWDAQRLVSERTSYYDWYYGLKRLFRSGARPDVVVLMLSTRQWVDEEFRGDYSAHFLMDAVDVPALAGDLHLHPTKTANLLMANASRFWGSRSELRNFALQFVLPNLPPLIELFTSAPGNRGLRADDVERVARERIARLRALTDQYDARLVLVVPPTLAATPTQSAAATSGWKGLKRAAEAAGVTLITPDSTGTFAAKDFRDAGFHLNEAGAKVYTERLLPALRSTLTQVTRRPVPAGVQAAR